jgi:phosphoglycerate dehydrogenase-like enzyme
MIARGISVCYTGAGLEQFHRRLARSDARGGRRIPAAMLGTRRSFPARTEAGPVLDGKTIRLIGLGRIGARWRVLPRTRHARARWARISPMKRRYWQARRVSKEELLSAADVVSLHLVLSERTRGILGATELAGMKRGAILINTARAALIDEAALIDAVQSGRIIAALDVFHREPLPATHPLARAPNVVLTPHLGYSVIEVYREYYPQCVENALAFLDGKPIRLLSP